MELCREIVPSITDTEKDARRILDVRGRVADAIIALDAAPRLVVETEPPAGSTVYEGPIAIEVRGLTEPGTVIKVNGHNCHVGDDGNFVACPGPGRDGEVRVEAELGGKTRTVIKKFIVHR